MSPGRKAAVARLSGLVAALLAGFMGLVLLLYFTTAHMQAATSDSATVVLEGQAIAKGQILLHGWDLTFASYWTSTAAFDAVAIVLNGLRAGLMYAIPAFAGAVAIVGGVLVAREGHRGLPGFGGGVAVVVLLAFTTPAMAFFFVGHGFHVGTAAYALFAFVALRRGRFSLGWALALFLLSAGLLGDLLMLAYGVVPLLIAGLLEIFRGTRRQVGVATLTAAVGSVLVAGVARLVFVALGTYKAASGLRFARFDQMISNLGHVPVYVVSLLGLTNAVVTSGAVPAQFRNMRGIDVIAAMAALWVLVCFSFALVSLLLGLVRGYREDGGLEGETTVPWRLDNLLVIAVICSAVPFVLLAGARGAGIRYLTVTIIFVVVLAGRMIARASSKLRTGWRRGAFATAGTALTLGLAASFGVAMSGPEMSNPTTGLVAWLEAHDLRYGIGSYWVASITTVESGGEVTVRPVLNSDGDQVERAVLASASWYAGKHFQFLIEGAPTGYIGVQRVPATWGRPAHLYVVGLYRILVWSHELSVPAALAAGDTHTSAVSGLHSSLSSQRGPGPSEAARSFGLDNWQARKERHPHPMQESRLSRRR